MLDKCNPFTAGVASCLSIIRYISVTIIRLCLSLLEANPLNLIILMYSPPVYNCIQMGASWEWLQGGTLLVALFSNSHCVISVLMLEMQFIFPVKIKIRFLDRGNRMRMFLDVLLR